MNDVYISLGSNIGDRLQTLQHAVKLLTEQNEVEVVKLSSIYETDPVGFTDQDAFLNMVAHIRTALAPEKTLKMCQAIENELKRVRVIRWGPRTIDLDILLYNHDNIETETLTVPHPRMHERAFVLVPLLEIDPKLIDPKTNAALQTVLSSVGKEGVRQWKTIAGVGEFVHSEN
ncbi:2-amino-4-hydroxy-6-hydroxymethyldihydropteridine diphosphokinase [Viridibacillus sp. YIM B01967]|uniref:2-amino-4-hydroxy-6-hydroxymethyldihydropteridine diphosphokinase n=1 Tax=Viridibacillus soli TaxID=2798301 RepID=A0ABS1HBV6_9BACL|nr:2-amino-4-hydroxy-6-hydroxymethyldihydropteridine diphosphokinase [Viridibacillus soli]MBK3496892.1 2-amino-4-hydroxy-6-hydroxymethyldihydropteridine diphosphokinase [Viridibacillus soli]